MTPHVQRPARPHVLAATAALGSAPAPWPAELAALLERSYGWPAAVHPLSSEAEQTARLETPAGDLILKVSSRLEGAESFRFQSAVLVGLVGAAGFQVPRVVPTAAGQPCFGD